MNGLLLWIVVDVATCIAPSLSFGSVSAALVGHDCTKKECRTAPRAGVSPPGQPCERQSRAEGRELGFNLRFELQL